MEIIKVFVYGTLMRGGENYDKMIDIGANFITTGRIDASLYEVKKQNFPGVLLKETGSTIGEIFTTDKEGLQVLDEEEGYNKDDLENSCYTRSKINVKGDDGKFHECCVYEINPSKFTLGTLIVSGDWKEYTKTNPVQKGIWPCS